MSFFARFRFADSANLDAFGRCRSPVVEQAMIERAKKWAGATGADFVKATDDLGDVGDGTTYKRVANVSAGNLVQNASMAAGTISGDKFTPPRRRRRCRRSRGTGPRYWR